MRGAKLVLTLGASLLTMGFIGCGGAAGPAGEGHAAAATSEAPVRASSPCRQPMPVAALELTAGNELEFALDGVGVQIYTCTATATGAAWVFTAPEATLYGPDGHLAGTHYAGPTWKAKDGSTVVAARVAGATVDPTAIPWLRLQAVSHTGDGRMSEVTYVQRVVTAGGLAPAGGCSAAAVGAVARVPYTATYCFAESED
jgi:FtsP/CotA-like multicopper oxidase with cupredoxin domain